MEENINYLTYLKEQYQLEDRDINTYSPLTLAYIGDGIYELIIRSILVARGNRQVHKFHKEASSLVKAHTQSSLMEVLEPLLTPEEEQIYRRGRNAKSVTMAKNATMGDYRRATGFEALMGYCYLTGKNKRMMDLVKTGLDQIQALEK